MGITLVRLTSRKKGPGWLNLSVAIAEANARLGKQRLEHCPRGGGGRRAGLADMTYEQES